ncbi:Protein transport protein SEC23 [Grifola frondosa]|uniref:Protein transport protein SEC23 n=1 Tax=Grifola frondosa TaxID=5627 RepID=A0A1C7LUA6_GRIFR|nr:Protein transport protein SEC23 [Grifola frondosa]
MTPLESPNEEKPVDATIRTDWNALRRLSLQPHGFGQKRVDIWLEILNVDTTGQEPEPSETSTLNESATEGEDDSSSDEAVSGLLPHQDERQIGLDTDRSFVLYPVEEMMDKEQLQTALHSLIVSMFRKRRHLNYFQGYHDIISVIFLTLPEQFRLPFAEKLSLHRLRDSMGPNLEPVVGLLRLLQKVLRQVDPDFALLLERSSSLPYFALSNLLTMFSHDVPTLPLIQHVFDYLLCRPPVTVVYLAAAAILVRSEEVQKLEQEGEEGMIHSVLSGLPELFEDDLPQNAEKDATIFKTEDEEPVSKEDLDYQVETIPNGGTGNHAKDEYVSEFTEICISPNTSTESLPDDSIRAPVDIEDIFEMASGTVASQSPLTSSLLSESSRVVEDLDDAKKEPVRRISSPGPLDHHPRRPRVSLNTLFIRADELYTRYPPSLPSIGLSAIMGPQSVLLTWSENPAELPDDDDAELMVTRPELVVRPYVDEIASGAESDTPGGRRRKEEVERKRRRLRKPRRLTDIVVQRKTMVAGAVLVLGVAMAVYGLNAAGPNGGFRGHHHHGFRQEWKREEQLSEITTLRSYIFIALTFAEVTPPYVEERDGVRLSWNVWPSSRIEATRTVVPISALYTPLKQREDLPPVLYEPVTCKPPCRAVLNPYCQIDIRGKLWICPFCLQRNAFPPHYKDISNTNLPAELLPKYTTIEYTLSRPAQVPPVFLFVVDTCVEEEDLKALRDALVVSLSLIPPFALVGLITYGTMTQVHELGYAECSKSYVFRGGKEYTPKQIQDMLGLSAQNRAAPRPGQPLPPQAFGAARFLMPVQECEFQLTGILEALTRDPWPVANDKRPLRCTGVAISVAVGLLETTFPNTGARIMVFSGGPASEGPGMVVSNELKEPIRSHHDIDRDSAKHFKRATKFYEGLAKRVANNGHAVDIFAGCLDQVGLLEMKSLTNSTNGVIVLSDSFATSIFKQSFLRMFNKDDQGQLEIGFNATFDVQTTKELKVSGLIGHAISAAKKSPCVGETEIVYFEVVTPAGQPLQPGSRGLIQFVTHYQHASGQQRLRVTTIARNFAEAGSPSIAASFDQEAAAVLMARIAVFKAEIDDSPDVLRWLDRMLIRLCQKFADYRKEDPSSFRLTDNFSIYPQFMFHLRRSQFLQVFNNSPDETAFYRHVLNEEDVNNSLIMIQPTLMSYTFDVPPQPVLLDSVSLKPDVILLLDTFFHILIFHGDHRAMAQSRIPRSRRMYLIFLVITSWYHVGALAGSIPYPPLYRVRPTWQSGPVPALEAQPSTTHMSTSMYGTAAGATAGQAIFTDDVSLQVFMEHLKRLAVGAQTN